MNRSDDITTLRYRWLEIEYDSIMSNNPGNFVWNVLKEQVFGMSKDKLLESLEDMQAFEEDE